MPRIPVQCPNPDCKASGFAAESRLGQKRTCRKCGSKFVLTRSPRRSGELSFAAPVGDPAPLRESEPLATVLLEDFVVAKKLGEGGMGAVFLVRSKTSGQHFAVKRTRLRDESSRRNFLTELQTWLDLPEHPHLTACRFFRTIAEEIVVFAEYVAGGSLDDWIAGGKLTQLADILDVAIQFAWGLHAAHEAGVVHQDVKPGNVLLTAEGLVKVTDFGLARTRGVAGATQAPPGQSILVSCGGLTPAYCSPEQQAGKPLSRKTDIWSWGLSVLELFTGEVSWSSGTMAATALDHYLNRRPPDQPPMPEGVADVLRKCFRKSPRQRWANLEQAAQQLQAVYEKEVGTAYPRQRPALGVPRGQGVAEHDRRTVGGVTWENPRWYLSEVLRAAGQDPRQAEVLFPSRGGSRKVQAIADLAVYEEAGRLCQQLIGRGRKDLEKLLAVMCAHKALVYEYAEDLPGALAEYDRALALFERLVRQEGRRDLAHDLAMTYHNKAAAVMALRNQRDAAVLFDQAIALWEGLVTQQGRGDLANHLARAYQNKAMVVRALGDTRGAVALHDQAIAIRERLVHQEGRCELAHDLAMNYQNKAVAVGALGDDRGELALLNQALTIYEPLVHQEGRRDLIKDLALVYQNKAATLRTLGDKQGAASLTDQALAIYERLVHQEGHRELANRLAGVYQNKAVTISGLGDKRGALALYDQAIALRERLVHQEGRHELAEDLAWVYWNKALSVGGLGDARGEVALYDQALAIYERLVHQEGRRDLASVVARVYHYKGVTLRSLKDNREAAAVFDQAITLWEPLIRQEGRHDLANDLASSYQHKGLTLAVLGDHQGAAAVYDRAIALREPLVYQEGRLDLAHNLALGYQNKALALKALGDSSAALTVFDRPLVVLERLVHAQGRRELLGDLARLRLFRADMLLASADRVQAQAEVRAALPVLQAEMERTGRTDLKGSLQWAISKFAQVL